MKNPSQGTNAQGLSNILAWACLLLAVLLPVAALYSLLQLGATDMLLQLGIRLPPQANANTLRVEAWQHGLAIAISMLPVCAVAYALVRARQCFSGFVRGETFSLSTVRHLRGFATGLLLSSSAGLLAPTAVVWLLSLHAAAGGQILTLNLGSQQLLMLLFSGIIWQMAQAMTRAVELAEDNAQII